jgi:formylglycine-generating enzyme required for sulfatase activity
MLGNEYEWVQDGVKREIPRNRLVFSDIILNEDQIIDKIPRGMRGGTYSYEATIVRSANRFGLSPAYRNTNVGFRPSRTYH